MAQVKSIVKNVKGSVKKVKIPADIVKGMDVDYALAVLEYMPKRAAKDVWKVVNSAKANAVNNFQLEAKNLYIEEIKVDKGRGFKRFKAGSRGSAKPIWRHFSHISVVVSDVRREKLDPKAKAIEKVEAKKVVKTEKKETPVKTKKTVAKKKVVSKAK